jgi:CBS domain-containing protein
MLVKEMMTAGPETVGPGETLQSAARRMKDTGVGSLLVCERDHVVGILTDRDIVVRCVAAGRDPAGADVRSAMTPQVVTCVDDADLAGAARAMEDGGVRRLVVVDAADRPVGVVSVDDLALYSRELAGEVIEHMRDPERPLQRVWPWWE